jgi:hypothetical protein
MELWEMGPGGGTGQGQGVMLRPGAEAKDSLEAV